MLATLVLTTEVIAVLNGQDTAQDGLCHACRNGSLKGTFVLQHLMDVQLELKQTASQRESHGVLFLLHLDLLRILLRRNAPILHMNLFKGSGLECQPSILRSRDFSPTARGMNQRSDQKLRFLPKLVPRVKRSMLEP